MTPDLFHTEIFAPLWLDADGTVLDVGRGWQTILGVDAAEIMGRPLRDWVTEADQSEVDKTLDNLAKGAPSAVIRIRSGVGGRARRLKLRLQPVDERVLLVAEDVTRRKAGVARDATLRSLADHAHDAWFVHDMEGRIHDVNPWACESLGYSRSEILSMHLAEIERTIKPGRMDGVWNRMEIGQPLTVEGRHRRKDGSEFPVEVRLSLFETGDEVLMLAMIRDITARKEAERRTRELNDQLSAANTELTALSTRLSDEVAERTRELARVASQLEATFTHLVDGLCALDAEGTVQVVNPAFLQLLGCADPTGRPASEGLPEALCELVALTASRHGIQTAEVALPGQRIGQVVGSPIGQPGAGTGQGDGVVLLVRDVTLEREIDRMKTDFIATVSHELRTPLTSVLGFAKLTSQRLESKVFPHIPDDDSRAQRAVSQVRGNVGIILAEGQRLTALINDVLDISKMESGRMEWHKGPVHPRALVERAVAATSALFGDDGDAANAVTLQTEIEDGLPGTEADEDRILQVLINLISNAAKFTREGIVEVGVRQAARGLEFWVRDTGEGIAPELHESIFEKFRQVGDTLTNKPQGTGLGLPICKQIVTAHGGEIRVVSAPGAGSTFTFTLAVTESEAALFPEPSIRDLESLVQRIEATVPRRELPQAGSDVLVVDDDPSLRELLRQQLADRGYTIRLASNGREAMAEVRARRPDLVILDVMMPELSGFDVAAMLKADPDTQSIPILILSIVQDKERGLRLGVDRYLTKPADPDVLLNNVQDLLEQVRSPRRVLVVDDSATATTDIVGLLKTKGYDVVGTCVGADCIKQARETQPDLILVESLVGDAGDLVRTIRFERGLEHVYVVQLMDEEAV